MPRHVRTRDVYVFNSSHLFKPTVDYCIAPKLQPFFPISVPSFWNRNWTTKRRSSKIFSVYGWKERFPGMILYFKINEVTEYQRFFVIFYMQQEMRFTNSIIIKGRSLWSRAANYTIFLKNLVPFKIIALKIGPFIWNENLWEK